MIKNIFVISFISVSALFCTNVFAMMAPMSPTGSEVSLVSESSESSNISNFSTSSVSEQDIKKLNQRLSRVGTGVAEHLYIKLREYAKEQHDENGRIIRGEEAFRFINNNLNDMNSPLLNLFACADYLRYKGLV